MLQFCCDGCLVLCFSGESMTAAMPEFPTFKSLDANLTIHREDLLDKDFEVSHHVSVLASPLNKCGFFFLLLLFYCFILFCCLIFNKRGQHAIIMIIIMVFHAFMRAMIFYNPKHYFAVDSSPSPLPHPLSVSPSSTPPNTIILF
jgi:hypothetical protein